MKSSRWFWMLPIWLLAFLLAARMLTADLYWWDEVWSLDQAGAAQYGPKSLLDVWRTTAHDDPWQTPGYYMLLHTWTTYAGWNEVAGRTLSLLLGLLTVAWVYRLGADLIRPRVGIYAAALLAGSAFYGFYLHEMRAYTLHTLFTCMFVWSYWRLISAQDRPRRWEQALFVLSLIGLFYTHLLAMLTAAAVGIYHLLFVAKNRRWWMIAGLALLAGIGCLPWLGTVLDLIRIAADDPRKATSMSEIEIITTLPRAFSNNITPFVIGLMVVALPSLFSGSKSMTFRRGRACPTHAGEASLAPTKQSNQHTPRLLWTWLLAGMLTVLVIDQFLPVFIHVRYLMAFIPALALLAALGVEQIYTWTQRIPGINPHPLPPSPFEMERGKVNVALPSPRRGEGTKGRGHYAPALITASIIGIWVFIGAWRSIDYDEMAYNLPNSAYRVPRAGFMLALDELRQRARPGDTMIFHISPTGIEYLATKPLSFYLYGIPGDYYQLEAMPDTFAAADESTYRTAIAPRLDTAPVVWTVIVPEVPITWRQDVFFDQLEQAHSLCATLLDREDMIMRVYALEPEQCENYQIR